MNIMATRTIAPDYNLSNMPFQQASRAVARLPNWNYSTGTPWDRDNQPAIPWSDWTSGGTPWILRRLTVEFNINNFEMTYEDGGRSVPVFFTPANWVITYVGWIYSFRQLSNAPTGGTNHPWPGTSTFGAGLLTVSPAYNYQLDWTNSGSGYVPILVAPYIDTTGWGRPIPVATAPAPPANNYTTASATSLNSYIATWERGNLNATLEFPLPSTVVNKTIARQSSFYTIRIVECAGLTSGTGLVISAPIRINQSDVVGYYANNVYLSPYFYKGTVIITSTQAVNPTDQVFIVLRNSAYERLTFRKAPNPPDLPANPF